MLSGDARMDFDAVLTAIRSWPAEERFRLIGEVWDDLADPDGTTTLTAELEELLDRRVEALEGNPDAVIPWDVVEARALERFRK
jgi:putative addiction module component (TIGR02574 family)